MAAVSGLAMSLSSNYYLRNFYSANRDATKATSRKELSPGTLSKADSKALSRAVKQMRKFDYVKDKDDETSATNIYTAAKAYVETYNNAMQSSSGSSDTGLNKCNRYLKNLTSQYRDELEDIGITIDSDGKLELDENLLQAADIEKVKFLFGEDSDFMAQTGRYAKRMESKADSVIHAEITGRHINVVV